MNAKTQSTVQLRERVAELETALARTAKERDAALRAFAELHARYVEPWPANEAELRRQFEAAAAEGASLEDLLADIDAITVERSKRHGRLAS